MKIQKQDFERLKVLLFNAKRAGAGDVFLFGSCILGSDVPNDIDVGITCNHMDQGRIISAISSDSRLRPVRIRLGGYGGKLARGWPSKTLDIVVFDNEQNYERFMAFDHKSPIKLWDIIETSRCRKNQAENL